MFTTRYKSLSVHLAYFLALSLLCFGAVNGLASQQVKAMRILYCKLVGNGWPNLSSAKPMYYYYYIGEKPSYYEAFPVLQDLKTEVQNNGTLIDYVPYGTYPLNSGGYQKYPFFYRQYSDINAGTIPDDWTMDDVNQQINKPYQDLPTEQKQALKPTFTAGYMTGADGQPTDTKYVSFQSETVGTPAFNGGVYTYNQQGNVVVSFPDNTGYASGYKPQPDGSYTPVYYTVDNGNVTEFNDITPPTYDTLTYDTNSSNYSLSIPNYSKQLDKIINKLDTLTLDNITLQVPAPEVTVNPEITVPPPVVNVASPEVTVNPEITVNPPEVNLYPEITVNPPEVNVSAPEVTVNVDTSSVTSNLSEILDTLTIDNVPTSNVPSDITLDSDEQGIVYSLRCWETDIPLLGDAVDFGLNSLLGKIPKVGTEYVWMDLSLGSSKRSLKASSNNLDGYHIRIDLTPYRDTLLAIRGWLIILEALFFLLLIYRNVREALQV